MVTKDARGTGLTFGRAVEAYERSRPGYPAAALDWVLPPGARQVVDVGAGTGKLTRELVARGLSVTAVEPDGAMRAELERRVPQATALAGTGESLPLPDGCADAVLFAQSWHWVDPQAAGAEVARVLRPGGRLGLLWNLRDNRVPWVHDLEEIMMISGGSPGYGWDPGLALPGSPLESREVAWTHRLAVDALVDMVASRSYVIDKPDAERAAVLARVRELVATHPDLAGQDAVDVPYLTHCYRMGGDAP